MNDESFLQNENTMASNVSLFPHSRERKCTRGGGKKCPQCVIKYFSRCIHKTTFQILEWHVYIHKTIFEKTPSIS